jgi:hypothetical protein
MPSIYSVPCEHCGTQADFVTEVSALGSDPGRRVYFCDSCKRSTWVTWPVVLRTPPQMGQPVQQQQQQPQPKNDPPKE